MNFSFRIKIVNIVFLSFLIFVVSLNAQESDYEIVENFKLKYKKLSSKIKNNSDKKIFEELKKEIEQLNSDYIKYKGLINEAIYPENFVSYFNKIEGLRESSISKTNLSNNLKSARNENVILSDKLNKLTSDYDKISNDNSLLSKQIKFLQKQSKKDKNTIDKINSLLSDMKENIRKRDNLVAGIIDSLFADFNKPKLTDIDKTQLLNIANDNNFIGKILFTINQNIKFLESSSHNAEDISFAMMEYEKFLQLWNKLSPNLLNTYLDSDQSGEVFEMINERFVEWKNSLKTVSWISLYDFMVSRSIGVESFSDNIVFKDNVIGYIDRQISNSNGRDIYTLFADTVWDNNVKKEWIPILIDNNYITEPEIVEIEAKITEWEGDLNNWFLIISLSIFGLVIIVFVVRTLLNLNKDE